MLALQDADGLVFWNEWEIASITPEFRGRWRAVHRDGRVAHRPTAPPPGPWLKLGAALVNPAYLRFQNNHWLDPAGFAHSGACETTLPPPPTLPDIEGVPVPRHQIYALQSDHKKCCRWLTDAGEFLWKSTSAARASQLMPELLMLKKGLYVSRHRLARIRRQHPIALVTLDNALTYRVTDLGNGFPQRLGLPNLVHLEPRCEALYGNYQLRDWPFDLSEAPASFLRATFKHPRMLIAHLIYQRLRHRQRWSDGYRSFWYQTLKLPLHRAGFLGDPDLDWDPPEEPDPQIRRGASQGEKLYHLMFEIFAYFVLDARLFTFHEFGFRPARPDCQRLGATRPETILVTEKEEFSDGAIRLHQEFGVSLRLLAGQPSALATEYFARVLPPTVQIIAYVDYDVGGWIVARALAAQLQALGTTVTRVIFMITSEAFTPQEKRLHARPLPKSTAADRTKSRKWFEETGGVDGQPLGLHADHIKPFSRLRDLFLAALQKLAP